MNILPIISLFLPLRGGHFETMETVTGALRFFWTYYHSKQQKYIERHELVKITLITKQVGFLAASHYFLHLLLN